MTLSSLNKLLKEEILLGDKYAQRIQNDEFKWIKAGLNPEIKFSNRYYLEPSIPKRSQKGVAESEFLENTLISDPSIGNTPALVEISNTLNVNQLDSALMQVIDLAYVRYSEAQKTASKAPIKKESSSYFYLFIIIAILLSIIVGISSRD